jgi:hypothetical protein
VQVIDAAAKDVKPVAEKTGDEVSVKQALILEIKRLEKLARQHALSDPA